MADIEKTEPQNIYKIIRKNNDLIQKSRYNLTLTQQKIVLFLIAQINPFDDDFKEYAFDVKAFAETVGIDVHGSFYYKALKQAIKDVSDQSLWIDLDDEEETEALVRWIEEPKITRKSGKVRLRLNHYLKKYLLHLSQNFTQYELVYTLQFRCKYSIRLYELLQSVHYHKNESYTYEFKMQELRQRLGAENYIDFHNFKVGVLAPAVNEINEYSEKKIEYLPIKDGRAVAGIRFTIANKPVEQRIAIASKIEEAFGYEQIMFDGM